LQFGFDLGQQRFPTATSVSAQQTSPAGDRIRCARAQHVFLPVCWWRAQVLPLAQHPLPQHSPSSAQQWSPQHFSLAPQHFSPQHFSFLSQQWSSLQHFCFLPQQRPLQHASPFSQQRLFPHFLVFGGQCVQRPLWQRSPGGQHLPLQQASLRSQQLTVPPPLHTCCLARQQYSRSGSAHCEPSEQQIPPHSSWPVGQPKHSVPWKSPTVFWPQRCPG
jgi:hypothetical protein